MTEILCSDDADIAMHPMLIGSMDRQCLEWSHPLTVRSRDRRRYRSHLRRRSYSPVHTVHMVYVRLDGSTRTSHDAIGQEGGRETTSHAVLWLCLVS
jgi:hypothetical protein